MGKRIKDLSRAETDGYLAVDNATNGTGKMNTSVIFNNFAEKYNKDRLGGYKAGEKAVIDGVLKQANSDIAQGETYSAGKWDTISETSLVFDTWENSQLTPGGNGVNSKYCYGIKGGDHIRVVFYGSNWTTASVISGYAICSIIIMSASGATLADYSSYAINYSKEFVAPEGASKIRLRARGDSGCEVRISVSNLGKNQLYNSIGSKQGIDLFENGNVNMTSSGNGYSDSTSRVRTKANVFVRVNKGDYIETKDTSIRMYVNFLKDGESSWVNTGSWIALGTYGQYVFGDDGVCVLLFRLQPETNISVDDIMNKVRFVSPMGGFSDGERLLRYIEEKSTKPSLSDTQYKTTILGVSSAVRYTENIPVQGDTCVKVDFPATDMTGVTDGYMARGVYLENQTLYYWHENRVSGSNTQPANSYIIYIPPSVSYIRVGVRANENVAISLTRVEIKTRENGLFKSVAHRGCRVLAPQNTIPAYKIASACGFRYVETDVRKTSDGYLVCAHDDDISGVSSDGTGNISELTLAQLKSYHFDRGYCTYFANTTIMTYTEFLTLCKKLGLNPVIDIKQSGLESQLVSEADALGILDKVTFVRGYISELTTLRTLAPNSRLGLLLSSISSQNITDILSVSTKPDRSDVFLDVDHNGITSENIELAKNAGVAVECWTTRTSPNDYVSGLTYDGMSTLENDYNKTEMSNIIQ